MPGITVDEFERLSKRRIEIWSRDVAVPLDKIAKLNEEIAKLEAGGSSLPADQKKRLEQCRAARAKLQQEAESLTDDLQRDLTLISPIEKAPASELEKLAKKVKEQIKKYEKGLPLGGNFFLKPDIEFDFKKLKLKKAGVILEWRF